MVDNRLGRVGWMLVAGLAAFVATSCDDEKNYDVAIEDASTELGDAYCARMFDCSCEDGRFFSSEDECRAQVEEGVEQIRGIGEGGDLIYDPSCLGEVLRALDETGCGPIYAGNDGDSECARPCSVYHGDASAGQPCQWLGAGVTNCAQGLQCDGAICYDPCQGGNDRGANGESCLERGCQEGLYCDGDTCRPLPDVGQPCEQAPCKEGLFCDQIDPNDPITWICAAPRDNGADCTGHSQCQSRHCPVGKCEPMPRLGDACPANVCLEGLQCVEGKCEAAPPVLCWSNVGLFGGY